MSVPWMPYPHVGTSVEDGWWLCTVEGKHGALRVGVFELSNGYWLDSSGTLLDDEIVVAISWVPEPASLSVRKESKRAAKGKV